MITAIKKLFQKTIPEPRMVQWLDYRNQYWGHAIGLDEREKGSGRWHGHMFSYRSVNPGDYFICKGVTPGRVAIMRITHVKWCRDPHDMYFIDCDTVMNEIDFGHIENAESLKKILRKTGQLIESEPIPA